MKPTYEELEKQLGDTQKLLQIALAKIAKLEELLNKNSKNSSKPPSSDQKPSTLETGNEKEAWTKRCPSGTRTS